MSRLRSSRGSSAAATTARPAATRRPGVLVQTPRSDVFVAMLGVALGAILIACLLMLLILWRYDFKVNSKLAARDPGAQTLTVAARSGDLPSQPIGS